VEAIEDVLGLRRGLVQVNVSVCGLTVRLASTKRRSAANSSVSVSSHAAMASVATMLLLHPRILARIRTFKEGVETMNHVNRSSSFVTEVRQKNNRISPEP
jgi:hypothetical protein